MPMLPARHTSQSLYARRHRFPRTVDQVTVLVATLALSVLATSSPVAAAPSSQRRTCAQPGVSTYTVVDGDSWFVIAQSVEVRTRALLDVNSASVDTAIHPGDGLCLPAGAVAPVASAGASCASSGTGTYVVGDGDSWSAIAKRVGVRMPQLLEVNGAAVDDTLLPEQLLCLPAGATPVASRTKATPLTALPLQGPCGFGDTWRDARANGRRHEGVDLIARAGRYVYAVADGTLTRRAWAQPGLIAGNAWWLTSSDGSGTYFFYAHLYDFAQGLKPGSQVKAGQIIGFVGDTGSAATAHLHFEIHPGGGDPINPYPAVRALGGCNNGTTYRQPGGWVPDTGGVDLE